MRRAFLSKRAGDFAISAGFRRLRGYISSAARRAPASAANLPTLFEARRNGHRNARRRRHRACKPGAILFPLCNCLIIENIPIIGNLRLFAAKNGFETASIERLLCQRFQQGAIFTPRTVGQAKVVENLDQALLAQAGPVKVRIMVRAQQVMGRLADDLIILFGR